MGFIIFGLSTLTLRGVGEGPEEEIAQLSWAVQALFFPLETGFCQRKKSV